jgi:hypothetical protein
MGLARVTPSTQGTFDYGLRCTGGSLSQSKSFRLVVDNSPPFVELLPISTTVRFALTPADYIRYSFRTNLSDCTREVTGIQTRYIPGVPGTSIISGFISMEGEAFIPPAAAGTGLLTFTCRPWPYGPNAGGPGASASIPITVLAPLAPTVSMSVSARSVPATGSFTLTWNSTSSVRCFLDANSPAGPNSSEILEPVGSMVISGGGVPAGNWEYRLTCNSIDGLQPAATATALVRMEAAANSSPPAGGDGGGGGGGATRLAELLLLSGLLALRRTRHGNQHETG